MTDPPPEFITLQMTANGYVQIGLLDIESLYCKLDTGDLEPGTIITAFCPVDVPAVGIVHLLDDRESKAGSFSSG